MDPVSLATGGLFLPGLSGPGPALHPRGGDGAAGRPALLDLREADAASSWGRGAPPPMGDPRLPGHRRHGPGQCLPDDDGAVEGTSSRWKVTLTG